MRYVKKLRVQKEAAENGIREAEASWNPDVDSGQAPGDFEQCLPIVLTTLPPVATDICLHESRFFELIWDAPRGQKVSCTEVSASYARQALSAYRIHRPETYRAIFPEEPPGIRDAGGREKGATACVSGVSGNDTESMTTQRTDAHGTSANGLLPTVDGRGSRDFFVSYNDKDKDWAEWIAWTLEEAGYSVAIQAWDFRPGANFVLEMQNAAEGTDKTIAVLSADYLNADFTQPEWAAALAKDPHGRESRLIPVRVGECSPSGLLGAVVYVDLVDLPEDDARSALLGAFSVRSKPTKRPRYPGEEAVAEPVEAERVVSERKEYPGESHLTSVVQSLNLDQQVSVDLDRQSMSPQERLTLNQQVNGMPPQQFNMLVFALNPPRGVIPPMPAPPDDRSHALLEWAESAEGCGLTMVTEVVKGILHAQ